MQYRRLVLAVVAAGIAGLVLVGVFVAYSAYTLPLAHSPASELPQGAVVYANSAGEPFAARGVFRGDRITAEHLPQNLAHAVIAIEDRRFYQHHGIDLRGILRAAGHNLFHPHNVEGASTITQQLARLSYLSAERTLRRKVQEGMLALWLESRLGKNEILARYLNAVYFGAGAVGADAAARRYFGKKASELDVAQAAMLAGLIRAPSQLSSSRNREAAHRRAVLVIEAMRRAGFIDEQQEAAAKVEKVKLAVPPETVPDDNYFLDAAEGEIKRLIGAPPLDLSVTTTFDPRLQDLAERVVRHWLAGEGAHRHVGQAALVAMKPDGAILALVGGRDYGESQFNRVTQAHRQPGSLFKIVVYLTALANGYTPDSVVVDQPVQIGDWQPKNYDGRYRGPVTLRTAFAQSINSVAAQLGQAAGIDKIVATARSLGIQSELPTVPSLALGSAEVNLLEMTRAMNEIATDTKSVEPYTITGIRSQAATLYTRPETTAERPDWQPAWAPMMQLLEAVVSDGTGKAARLDRRSAGKTGTSEDYRDAWFVGFTTDLVVGVWCGNDDNSPMDKVAGGDIPAHIWHDFVSGAARVLGAPTPPARAPAPPSAAVAAAAAEPTGFAGSAAPPPPAPAAQYPSGVPLVVDSATLLLNDTLIRLDGIKGEGGEPAHELLRYIAGRPVSCAPAGRGGGRYDCHIGAYDLGEAILLNGAGRAAGDAPERLRHAEEQARLAHRGIWAP